MQPPDTSAVGPYVAVIVGIIAWAGSVWVAHINGKSQRQIADAKNDATLEQHTDNLAIQMLTAAQEQIERLNAALTRLAPLEMHYYHLQQCIGHCRALLECDEHERASVEKAARAFIKRLERLVEAEGTFRNEGQIAASSISLAGRLARGIPIEPLSDEQE